MNAVLRKSAPHSGSKQLEFARKQDFSGFRIRDDLQVKNVALTLPLAGDQRRLGDIVDRTSRPVDRADDRIQSLWSR